MPWHFWLECIGNRGWIGIGVLNTRVVVVVYTDRNGDSIRIISVMKATSHERIRYEQLLRDQLGTG